MDRRCFAILCHLLRTIAGLTLTEVVDVEEMVAMFLHILAHDVKNRVIQREFMRSGETISRHFNMVLLAVIRLHEELLKKPQPVPNECIDQRWSYALQNCLGALDGTYIKVNVPASDRARKDQLRTHASSVMPFQDLMGLRCPRRVSWHHTEANAITYKNSVALKMHLQRRKSSSI
ncbi:putative nuclease HARBI1 [Cucumis melo var. makuwa]|uniref:Nuclease HARBI1 n=1 Tax=Cucumis melo var. makuwa TaxID=1194695 RepID=A0A5A7U8N7_CUCMM|nr:putative nuclease HARBI1 [Cucumis melo var. makuwa]TYK01849.1 putative nuclease HARBI1 [Cucumis melo var. makuwa]